MKIELNEILSGEDDVCCARTDAGVGTLASAAAILNIDIIT